jgi:hypothetical protein
MSNLSPYPYPYPDLYLDPDPDLYLDLDHDPDPYLSLPPFKIIYRFFLIAEHPKTSISFDFMTYQTGLDSLFLCSR